MPRHCRLSIAIPTFNGGGTIPRVLAAVVPQLGEDTELLISDNASADNTTEVIREYQTAFPAIRYFRNEENLGFDGNVDLCVRRSRGDFVWLLADDDIVANGAVQVVLDIIRRYSHVCEIYVDSLKPHAVLSDDLLCASGDQFFAATKFRCGGLSSNVVNRAIWEQTDLSAYMGSGWVHMAYLIKNANRFPAYIYKDSLKWELCEGPVKRADVNYYFRAMLNLVKMYGEMPDYGYSPKTKNDAVLGIKRSYPKYIPMHYKTRGLRVDLKLLKDCIGLYGAYPSFWLVDLPLLLLPGIIFRAIRRVYEIPSVTMAYRDCKRWGRRVFPSSAQ